MGQVQMQRGPHIGTLEGCHQAHDSTALRLTQIHSLQYSFHAEGFYAAIMVCTGQPKWCHPGDAEFPTPISPSQQWPMVRKDGSFSPTISEGHRVGYSGLCDCTVFFFSPLESSDMPWWGISLTLTTLKFYIIPQLYFGLLSVLRRYSYHNIYTDTHTKRESE